MKARDVDPRQQFSKKLAGRTEWFWFLYLILLLVIIYLRPEVAAITVYLSIIVTTVMLVSVLAYTRNSMYEKGLYAANEMAKIKFNWKLKTPNGTSSASNTEEEEEDGEDDENG